MFISPFQEILTEAIKKQLMIELRYKDDVSHRIFHPYWLYVSNPGNTIMGGWQERNPNKGENNIYHKFELRFVKDMVLTQNQFDIQTGFPITRPKDCFRLICGLNGY